MSSTREPGGECLLEGRPVRHGHTAVVDTVQVERGDGWHLHAGALFRLQSRIAVEPTERVPVVTEGGAEMGRIRSAAFTATMASEASSPGDQSAQIRSRNSKSFIGTAKSARGLQRTNWYQKLCLRVS